MFVYSVIVSNRIFNISDLCRYLYRREKVLYGVEIGPESFIQFTCMSTPYLHVDLEIFNMAARLKIVELQTVGVSVGLVRH